MSSAGAERPRVAVYTIARNEAEQVERWARSASEADILLIGDTGSTDGTAERARELGIEVHEARLEPFRFDTARNQALNLLPETVDVCISLDMDEVLLPGWRRHLERAWRGGATRLGCRYEWQWSDSDPPHIWTQERIHARHGYQWVYPVHEQLEALGGERRAASGVTIRHLRDPASTRPAYLELLRLGVTERPDDPRLAHMLANEARASGLHDDAREWFRRALELEPAANERLHSMLMLSLLEPERRSDWLLQACAQFPDRREPWCELAQLLLELGQSRAARRAVHRALAITRPADDYLTNPHAWAAWPDEVAAEASRLLGDHEWESHHARRAATRSLRCCLRRTGPRSPSTPSPATRPSASRSGVARLPTGHRADR
jgi:tetratricopeptide (TPR) repeat protein